MKIKYDTGIVGKENAECRLIQLQRATQLSKLPFIWSLEYTKGVYYTVVELSINVFNTWAELEEYIRKLVIRYNQIIKSSAIDDIIQELVKLEELPDE